MPCWQQRMRETGGILISLFIVISFGLFMATISFQPLPA
jgi:hypothetical protein